MSHWLGEKKMGMTRRDFVERSAISALAAAVSPRLLNTRGDAEQRGAVYGDVRATVSGATLRIEKELIAAEWQAGNGLTLNRVLDKRSSEKVDARSAAAFWISFDGLPSVSSTLMKMTARPRVEDLPVAATASRFSEKIPGNQIVAEFAD